VNHQELDSILQFVYFGKTWVDHSRIKKFAEAAKDLQIKKLAENIRLGNQSGPRYDDNDDIPNEDNHEDNADEAEKEFARRSILDAADEIINLDLPGSDELGPGKQLYKCEECEASYKSRSGLWQHTSSKHEGICYSCEYCGYKATHQSHLKTHKQSVHEGVKYSCNHCDHQATTQSSLRTHKQSVHEGVKYPCNQCDYQATRTTYLKDHIKVVHEGLKYSCDQCDYQATRQDHLKTHKKRVHDGVKL